MAKEPSGTWQKGQGGVANGAGGGFDKRRGGNLQKGAGEYINWLKRAGGLDKGGEKDLPKRRGGGAIGKGGGRANCVMTR